MITNTAIILIRFDVKIEYPKDESHGDYACSLPLKLTKELSRPPKEIAGKIVDALDTPQYLEKVEIADPGFINFYLKNEWLLKEIEKIIEERNEYGNLEIGKDKTIVIDFSQPKSSGYRSWRFLLSVRMPFVSVPPVSLGPPSSPPLDPLESLSPPPHATIEQRAPNNTKAESTRPAFMSSSLAAWTQQEPEVTSNRWASPHRSRRV